MSDRISKGHGVSRRSFLKTSAAVGLGVVASPAIVSNAFSSSGEVNFMGWSGYDFKKMFEAFTAKTGIKVNFIEQPDQDSMLRPVQALAADRRRRPRRADRRPGADLGRQRHHPALGRDQGQDGRTTTRPSSPAPPANAAMIDGKRFFVPSVWGTEALTYTKQDAPMDYGKASLGRPLRSEI